MNVENSEVKPKKNIGKIVARVIGIIIILGLLGSCVSGGSSSKSENVAKDTETATVDNSTSNSDTESDVSLEYLNALHQAQSYSDIMHMSKQRIYEQLISEYGNDFPKDAAKYAIEHVDADWNANALATAKNYYETMHMSKNEVRDQLISEYGEQFTKEQAEYAIKHLND